MVAEPSTLAFVAALVAAAAVAAAAIVGALAWRVLSALREARFPAGRDPVTLAEE